jgi:DNA primase
MRRLFGPAPQELVRQMFESRDPDLRRSAIERLSARDWGRRDPYLKAYALLAGDTVPSVRSAAVRALGRGGDARYAEPVVAALKDPDEHVRWDAAAALDLLVDERAVAPLAEAAVSDPSVDVRLASARALRHYRTREAGEALLRCLDDPEFSVQFQAGESLKQLTGESAGTDVRAWRALLGASGVPVAPPPRRARPWWDWMGVARRASSPKVPASAPARPPRTKRPWWDWMGLTQRASSPKVPASAPARPPRTKRPWWDWMGVIGR